MLKLPWWCRDTLYRNIKLPWGYRSTLYSRIDVILYEGKYIKTLCMCSALWTIVCSVVPFFSANVLSVLIRFTDSDYTFGIKLLLQLCIRGRRGRDRIVVGFTNVESVPSTTKVLNSNPAHGEVYLIQHYVIKFVSYLRQVGGWLRVLLFLLQ